MAGPWRRGREVPDLWSKTAFFFFLRGGPQKDRGGGREPPGECWGERHRRVLAGIAHEMVERAKGADDVVLLGIRG